jgi:hypothetical protein
MEKVNERSTTTRTEKVKQAKQTLDEHLQELASELEQGCSDRLIRYLYFCAQFHQYSFGNLILALCQRRNLTRIAGVKRWNKLGRFVKKGEKGIMILAPMTVKKRAKEEDAETGEDEKPKTITHFKPVYVFDVSQTPAMEQAVKTAGITLEYADHIPGYSGAHGISLAGRIILRNDLVPADAFRALAHEFAHELLHNAMNGMKNRFGKPKRTLRPLWFAGTLGFSTIRLTICFCITLT